MQSFKSLECRWKTRDNLDNVKVEKKEGGSITDTIIVQGIIIDKEIVLCYA
jgi:chaperonin GroEL (HSP60 family)